MEYVLAYQKLLFTNGYWAINGFKVNMVLFKAHSLRKDFNDMRGILNTLVKTACCSGVSNMG